MLEEDPNNRIKIEQLHEIIKILEVEDFNDYYCWICEKYRSEQFQESIPNKCPQCEMDMEYIEDYSDYYCWECDMYQEEM